MDWIQFWWPTVLGGVLMVYLLAILFSRRGEQLTRSEVFRRRNADGALMVFGMVVLLILLVGGQLVEWRIRGDFASGEKAARQAAETLKKSNQDWSLKHKALQESYDSLQTATELAAELDDLVPLVGRVFDGSTREALEGARITVSRYDPTKQSKRRVIAENVVSDGSGRFQILVPSPGPSGSLRTVIDADGYLTDRQWIRDVSPEKPLEVYLGR